MAYSRRAKRLKALEELFDLCVALISSPNAFNPIRARDTLVRIAAKVRELQSLPPPHLSSLTR